MKRVLGEQMLELYDDIVHAKDRIYDFVMEDDIYEDALCEHELGPTVSDIFSVEQKMLSVFRHLLEDHPNSQAIKDGVRDALLIKCLKDSCDNYGVFRKVLEL